MSVARAAECTWRQRGPSSRQLPLREEEEEEEGAELSAAAEAALTGAASSSSTGALISRPRSSARRDSTGMPQNQLERLWEAEEEAGKAGTAGTAGTSSCSSCAPSSCSSCRRAEAWEALLLLLLLLQLSAAALSWHRAQAEASAMAAEVSTSLEESFLHSVREAALHRRVSSALCATARKEAEEEEEVEEEEAG